VTVLPWLVCKLAFETLTVRDGGGVFDTPMPVTVSDWLVDAETVTEGTVTLALLNWSVCRDAFAVSTVLDGGGVLLTPTPVADRP
jgi:hypothetical protein